MMVSDSISELSTQLPFKITKWEEKASAAGCKIHSISELNRINKSDGTHLFSLLDVNITDPEGNRLPRIVFIRGNAVVAVPLLINEETDEKKFLMVRQRRVGNGELSLEFPAGMLDGPDDNPAEVAVREIYEETGLKIETSRLFPLYKGPLYSSVGASDEGIYYFGCIYRLSNEKFNSLNKQRGGNLLENENILIELLSRTEAQPQITSLQTLLGFYLFDDVLSHEQII